MCAKIPELEQHWRDCAGEGVCAEVDGAEAGRERELQGLERRFPESARKRTF